MTKQAELDKIKQHILADNVCPELAKTATQLVFGDGSPDAQLVFIGEAPGKHEDEQGKPFIGAAGKFLGEMLESIGLKRSDVYITNIVKYRPPNNRDPLPEEKKAFLPYLQAQLEVIQPVMVVTLGRHSLSCFLPDLQISKVHGQPKRIRLKFKNGQQQDGYKVIILPLFHPAAALYNGSMRQTLIDDFACIPAILRASIIST
jgi:DNA polymerase